MPPAAVAPAVDHALPAPFEAAGMRMHEPRAAIPTAQVREVVCVIGHESGRYVVEHV